MKAPEIIYIRRARALPPEDVKPLVKEDQLTLNLDDRNDPPALAAVARGWQGLENAVAGEFRAYGKVFKRGDRVFGARGERRVT